MRTLSPDLPPGWLPALAAEALAGIDATAARGRWQAALRAAPDDPALMAGYAHFLSEHGGPAADAERLYKAVLRAEPANAVAAAGLARLFLSLGRREEGLALVHLVLKLVLADAKLDRPLLAELMVYLYAHDRSGASSALATLKSLVASGVRTPGWSFDPNLQRAQDDGHPELALLRDLAKVLSHGVDAALLHSHVAWRLA